MSDGTIFDKILAGELSAERVYEDDDVLAFRDIRPQAPVHVLVIPKKFRSPHFSELRNEETTRIGVFLAKVAEVAVELGLDKGGYRVVFNNGPDAGQEVDYLHAHILGGRPLGWPPG